MEPSGNECWCVAQKPQNPVDNTNNDMIRLPLSYDGEIWNCQYDYWFGAGFDDLH